VLRNSQSELSFLSAIEQSQDELDYAFSAGDIWSVGSAYCQVSCLLGLPLHFYTPGISFVLSLIVLVLSSHMAHTAQTYRGIVYDFQGLAMTSALLSMLTLGPL